MRIVKKGIYVNGPNSHSVRPHIVRNDNVETNRSVMSVPGSLYLVRESVEDNESSRGPISSIKKWHRPVPGLGRGCAVQPGGSGLRRTTSPVCVATVPQF